MKQAIIEYAKSVAGILLVGVGILLLRHELNQTLIHIHHLLGNAPGGMLPMALMDEAQQTGGTNRILQRVLEQILIAAWPLALVSIGMKWSTELRP